MLSIHIKEKAFSKNKATERLLFLNTSFTMSHHRTIALCGRSGSGKSTLLAMLSGLDREYDGALYFEGNLLEKSEPVLAKFRRNYLSFVTQNNSLLMDRNIFDNVLFALKGSSLSFPQKSQMVSKALSLLGVNNFEKRYPNSLSGGEIQRVSLARALVKSPKIILADEPTGSLDETSEQEILDVFRQISDMGIRIVLVTHNQAVANFCEAQYDISNLALHRVR